MENEPDLRRYIRVLVKHRWLIIATTALAALAAFMVTWINSQVASEPLYEATAGVLIARMRTTVTFDARIRTVEDLPGYTYREQDAHRIALASLVKNGHVATVVSERLEKELGITDWDPARLLTIVSGRVVQAEEDVAIDQSVTSDLIEIKVRFADPDQAAWIANAWAEAYVEHVNTLYRAEAESLDAIQSQLDTAYQTYGQAERALLDFTADNQIAGLKLGIGEKQTLINELQANRRTANLEALRTERLTLERYYATAGELKLLLEDAESLRNQIQHGGASSTTANELALVLLKAQAFAGPGTLPANLQLQINLDGSEMPDIDSQVAEVDALIKALEERIAEVEAAIEEQADLLSNAEHYTEDNSPAFDEIIASLQEEERQLQVLLAQEQARERELTRARDLAWSTYSTLEVKAAELGIAAGITDVEVRFASPAVVPVERGDNGTPSNAMRNVGLAAVMGFMLGVGIALFLHYYDPAFDSSAVTKALFERRDTRKKGGQ